VFEVIITIVTGSSSAISTSKIRKITLMRKNRSENGSHADLLGSNPHLNGDLYSRSSVFLFDRRDVRIITAIVSVKIVTSVNVVVNISFNLFYIPTNRIDIGLVIS
jgi:hypothetical protein